MAEEIYYFRQYIKDSNKLLTKLQAWWFNVKK